jgi:hypothetical protein
MKRVSTYTTPVSDIDLASETAHRRNTILRLQQIYPAARQISIAQRGDGEKINPMPGEIIHIMSTGGRWGKSSEVRIHPDVIAEMKKIREQHDNDRFRAEWASAIEACGGCFFLFRDRDGDVTLREQLHDCMGSFGWRVATPAEAIEMIQRMRATHDRTYHCTSEVSNG